MNSESEDHEDEAFDDPHALEESARVTAPSVTEDGEPGDVEAPPAAEENSGFASEAEQDDWQRLEEFLRGTLAEFIAQKIEPGTRVLHQAIGQLQEQFDQKIKSDAQKNAWMENQYNELQEYRQGLLGKVKLGLAKELISEIDSYQKLGAFYAHAEFCAENYQKILRILYDAPDALKDILDRHDIFSYTTEEGEAFDPKIHHCVKKVATSDMSLNKTIHRSLREGFSYEGKVIRSEFVEVSIYEESVPENPGDGVSREASPVESPELEEAPGEPKEALSPFPAPATTDEAQEPPLTAPKPEKARSLFGILRRSTVWVLVATMGCTSICSCSTSDKQNTINQGTGLGALLGGIVGVGGGLLATQGKKGKTKTWTTIAAGAVGAALGAYLGRKWGESVALKKECYVKSEDAANACINDLDKRIRMSQSERSELNRAVAEAKKQRSALGSKASAAEKKEFNKSIGSMKDSLQEKVGYIRQDLRYAQIAKSNAVNRQKAQELDARIRELKKQKDSLSLALNQLDGLSYRHIS